MHFIITLPTHLKQAKNTFTQPKNRCDASPQPLTAVVCKKTRPQRTLDEKGTTEQKRRKSNNHRFTYSPSALLGTSILLLMSRPSHSTLQRSRMCRASFFNPGQGSFGASINPRLNTVRRWEYSGLTPCLSREFLRSGRYQFFSRRCASCRCALHAALAPRSAKDKADKRSEKKTRQGARDTMLLSVCECVRRRRGDGDLFDEGKPFGEAESSDAV
jgi:hypothetical protein